MRARSISCGRCQSCGGLEGDLLFFSMDFILFFFKLYIYIDYLYFLCLFLIFSLFSSIISFCFYDAPCQTENNRIHMWQSFPTICFKTLSALSCFSSEMELALLHSLKDSKLFRCLVLSENPIKSADVVEAPSFRM